MLLAKMFVVYLEMAVLLTQHLQWVISIAVRHTMMQQYFVEILPLNQTYTNSVIWLVFLTSCSAVVRGFVAVHTVIDCVWLSGCIVIHSITHAVAKLVPLLLYTHALTHWLHWFTINKLRSFMHSVIILTCTYLCELQWLFTWLESHHHHHHHIYSPIIHHHNNITKNHTIGGLPEKPYSSLTGRPSKKINCPQIILSYNNKKITKYKQKTTLCWCNRPWTIPPFYIQWL